MFERKKLESDEQDLLNRIKALEIRKRKIEDIAAVNLDDKTVQDAFLKGRNMLNSQILDLDNELRSVRRIEIREPIVPTGISHMTERGEGYRKPIGENVMTREGYNKLKVEIAALEEKKKEIAERKGKAAAQGDRSENAAYIQAVEDAQINETLLQTAKDKIAVGRVINSPTSSDKVSINSIVYLNNLNTGDDEEYTIVGKDESNPSEGKISYVTKVGAALMGRRSGDLVRVVLPNGTKVDYRIKYIDYRKDNI